LFGASLTIPRGKTLTLLLENLLRATDADYLILSEIEILFPFVGARTLLHLQSFPLRQLETDIFLGSFSNTALVVIFITLSGISREPVRIS